MGKANSASLDYIRQNEIFADIVNFYKTVYQFKKEYHVYGLCVGEFFCQDWKFRELSILI